MVKKLVIAYFYEAQLGAKMKTADKLLMQHGFDANGQKLNPNKKKRKKQRPIPQYSREIIYKNKWLIKTRSRSLPSPAETDIMKFLVENNVVFLREAYIPTLTNPQTGKLLFFDFYIPHHNLFIEFDGKHHYKNEDLEVLKDQKYRDRLKNEFCQKYAFNLLRIKFSDPDPNKKICQKFDELSGM